MSRERVMPTSHMVFREALEPDMWPQGAFISRPTSHKITVMPGILIWEWLAEMRRAVFNGVEK